MPFEARLYGVMSYMGIQRTQEFGIRMAVGASRGSVLGLVLRHAAELASAGLAIGLFATSMAARLVGSLLYEVRPFDLVTLATVSTLLIVVALLASYLPARRAANADPVKSLRCE